MKAFVTYLKKESPVMQLASGSTGWLELPNGQRWNPAHTYKFNTRQRRRSPFRQLLQLLRGRNGY